MSLYACMGLTPCSAPAVGSITSPSFLFLAASWQLFSLCSCSHYARESCPLNSGSLTWPPSYLPLALGTRCVFAIHFPQMCEAEAWKSKEKAVNAFFRQRISELPGFGEGLLDSERLRLGAAARPNSNLR